MATTKKKDTLAYTPRDSSGNDYAGMSGASDLDKAAIEAAKNDYARAQAAGDTAGMEAAHQQAEAVRQKYGYSGGSDGSQYIPTTGGASGTSGARSEKFSYEAAPEFTSRYDDAINEAYKALMNRSEFNYNPEEDPTYQMYKASYERGGRRAMQDTLGEVSARTGGLASSYAQGAAQQTYDNYMSALADEIPQLRQLAYEMYRDDLSDRRADINMLLGLEDRDRQDYLTRLGQYNTDRSFDYGAWSEGIDRDTENARYESETQYERDLARAQLLAAAGDFSGYKELGYSDADIEQLQRAYDESVAAASNGGYSGGGKPKDEDDDNAPDIYDYRQLYDAGIRTEAEAYAWYIRNGMSSTEASKMAKYYAGLVDEGHFTGIPDVYPSERGDVPGIGERAAYWARVSDPKRGALVPDAELADSAFDEIEAQYGKNLTYDEFQQKIATGEIVEYLSPSDGKVHFRRMR